MPKRRPTGVSKTICLVTSTNNVQKALESGDARDSQGDAPEDHHNSDSMPNLETYSDDGASDKDEQEHVHDEPEDDIVDETIRPSPTKMQTRSKTRKPVIPEAILFLILRTMNHALDSASVLMSSEPRYVQEPPNIFAETRTSSPVLPARHLRLVRHEQARREESDRVQDSASEEADSNLTTTLNFSVSSH